MKYRDLHGCLDSLGLGDLAEALLQCGLVDAVTAFKVMRTDTHTYVVLPMITQDGGADQVKLPLNPGRDCQPSAVEFSRGEPQSLTSSPVEKQGTFVPQLPSHKPALYDGSWLDDADPERAYVRDALIRLDK